MIDNEVSSIVMQDF